MSEWGHSLPVACRREGRKARSGPKADLIPTPWLMLLASLTEEHCHAGSSEREPRAHKRVPKLLIEGRARDLAMFNLAIDSELRGCVMSSPSGSRMSLPADTRRIAQRSDRRKTAGRSAGSL
jgi:hypothetical protein